MSNRMLGTAAMICAQALLVEAVITKDQGNHLVVGVASMVFVFGWICSNTAMRRLRATGTGKLGRARSGARQPVACPERGDSVS